MLLGNAGAITASVSTMLYASPSDEPPKWLTMNRLMRRPRPDLTTACATMNATTTSSTLALAKPENACAGVIVSVRTTAATASIVDVSSGYAPTSTDAMAPAKIANRCHAGAVSPAGTGANQMPSARANGNARLASSIALGHGFAPCAAGADGDGSKRTRPARPCVRPATVPSSASSTNCHVNS